MDKLINILLIEDNLDYARLIERILSKKEYAPISLEHRDTFKSGYERLVSKEFDLVLLDLNLPDSSTDETLANIRQVSMVPIIVLTGNDDDSAALKAVQMGAQDYLNKAQLDRRLLIRAIKYAVERSKVDERLRKTEERFRLLIENALDLISILEVNGKFKFISPSHQNVLGYDEEDLLGMRLFDFIHPEDLPGLMDKFTFGLQHPESSYTVEYRLKNKHGKWLTIESIAKIFPPDSAESGVIFNSRDVTERKEFEDKLLNLSITDDLTDLYNRRGFMMVANHYLKSADRKNQRVLLILIDVDKLKQINDAHGHTEGDRALIATTELIKGTFRESDIIARVGGDEFVILTSDSTPENIGSIENRITANLKAQNAKQKSSYELSISCGITSYDPSHPSTIDQLLDIADQLMYREKHRKQKEADAISR